jgi:hypothetical protein
MVDEGDCSGEGRGRDAATMCFELPVAHYIIAGLARNRLA